MASEASIYCGPLLLVSTCIMSCIQVYSQGRGNVVEVMNTNFTGNRAGSVGAAIMFQTFAYVQSRVPPYIYSFSDWYATQKNQTIWGP
jgi:hypothetical protein